jgi:aldehyde:ferredoxin oxidoreductase
MGNGYWNKFLEVDLTKGTWKAVPFDDAFARKFVGGTGFGGKMLFDRLPLHVDALSPDNILMLMFGPFNGTFFAGQKGFFMFKSPLTQDQGIGRTACGGSFQAEVRRAGWDGIILTGKSPNLVYLYIDDDTVELRDASFVAGKDSQSTCVMIQEQVKEPLVRVACIGPAGEHLVRFASIMTDTHRAFARTGAGAVAGSKNLKAIAVHGTKVVPLADAATYHETIKEARFACTMAQGLWPWQTGFRRHHTSSHAGNNSPLRNYTWSGDYLTAIKISSMRQEMRFYVDYNACGTFCDGACFSHGIVRSGKYTGIQGENSEWDTSPTILGTGLTDVEGAMAAVSKLDKLGMDGSSTGHTMGWAMECYDKGLLTKDDTGGLELTWDNPDLVNKLLVMIAFRQGFGDVLAEGTLRASAIMEKKKGLAAGTLLQYACQSRGLENAAVDPRPNVAGAYGAVGQATSARGGGNHITDALQWNDITGSCMFTAYRGVTDDQLVAMMKAITGWDYTKDEKTTDFERTVTLHRAFYVKEAWPKTPAELDYNAPKMYTLPIYAGPAKGTKIDKAQFETERGKYYAARGWDARGIPTKATLTKLGLDDLVPAMEKAGVTLT